MAQMTRIDCTLYEVQLFDHGDDDEDHTNYLTAVSDDLRAYMLHLKPFHSALKGRVIV